MVVTFAPSVWKWVGNRTRRPPIVPRDHLLPLCTRKHIQEQQEKKLRLSEEGDLNQPGQSEEQEFLVTYPVNNANIVVIQVDEGLHIKALGARLCWSSFDFRQKAVFWAGAPGQAVIFLDKDAVTVRSFLGRDCTRLMFQCSAGSSSSH
jgi:hypothetical protein